MKRRRERTVPEAVALAKRIGVLTINPLTYRKNPYKTAAFAAAKQGLLRKVRVDCGHFDFYPIEPTHDRPIQK